MKSRMVWRLDVMGQCFRCLYRTSGAEANLFALQVRTSKGWKPVYVEGGANDAAEILRRVCRVSNVISSLADAQSNAQVTK